MPPNEVARSCETQEILTLENALDYVRAIAKAYCENPNTEPTNVATFFGGATLNAEFVSRFDSRRGGCYMADGELPVEEDVKNMLRGSGEVFLNISTSKKMIRIWLTRAGEKPPLYPRDRVSKLLRK